MIQDPPPALPDARSRMPDPGFRIRRPPSWMPDTGCRIPDSGSAARPERCCSLAVPAASSSLWSGRPGCISGLMKRENAGQRPAPQWLFLLGSTFRRRRAHPPTALPDATESKDPGGRGNFRLSTFDFRLWTGRWLPTAPCSLLRTGGGSTIMVRGADPNDAPGGMT